MTIFVGANDMCITLRSQSGTSYVPRGLNFGGSAGGVSSTPPPAPSGWVTAVNADSGSVRWKYHADSAVLGGVTPTAGGIVMTGDNTGDFLVFDSDSVTNIAHQLGYYETIASVDAFTTSPARIAAVTVEEVAAAARATLAASNRTVGWFEPSKCL